VLEIYTYRNKDKGKFHASIYMYRIGKAKSIS